MDNTTYLAECKRIASQTESGSRAEMYEAIGLSAETGWTLVAVYSNINDFRSNIMGEAEIFNPAIPIFNFNDFVFDSTDDNGMNFFLADASFLGITKNDWPLTIVVFNGIRAIVCHRNQMSMDSDSAAFKYVSNKATFVIINNY